MNNHKEVKMDMFNDNSVEILREFIREQDKRKAQLGKPNFANVKLWEELSELGEEIEASKKEGQLTDNFINELGDLVFCVLGDLKLGDQLRKQLALAQLGKPNFALWEALSELGEEIEASEKGGRITDNFTNKLGDLVFCVLNHPQLGDQLRKRLAFDFERAKAYEKLDGIKLENPDMKPYLDKLKYGPSGWYFKE
jgi:NTP pyrophosphatase (non-canonical NTP hydrolase)